LEDNKISGRSLIYGMFRELAILGIPVIFKSDSEDRETRILLSDEALKPSSKEAVIMLDNISGDQDGTIVFSLDQNRYEGIMRSTDTESFIIPDTLSVLQRRSKPRSNITSLANEVVLAEVRGIGCRFWGKVKDCNTDHIVIDLGSNAPIPIKVNEQAEIRIYSANQQTLHSSAWLCIVRSNTTGTTEYVFCLNSTKSMKRVPRNNRKQLASPVEISLCWPNESGIHFVLSLFDIGFTGFAAILKNPEDELPPVGAVCRIEESELNARFVWIDEHRIGFDLRANHTQKLDDWHARIFGASKKVFSSSSSQKKRSQNFLSILLRSGYLLNKRAAAFVQQPELQYLIPGINHQLQWLRRYTSALTQKPDAHVSFCRLCDESWMIQELGNSSGIAGAGKEMLQNALFEFFTREQPFLTTNKALIALFDLKSRFNRDFWMNPNKQINSLFRNAVVLEFSKIQSALVKQNANTFVIEKPNIYLWSNIFPNLLHYNGLLLNAFGITNSTYDAPVLTDQLMQSGYICHRQIRLFSKSGRINAIAVVFGIPTLANVTATANAVWLLCHTRQDVVPALQTLLSLPSEDSFMLGGTDIIVICDDEDGDMPQDIAGKNYGFLVFPILNIPAFLGGKGNANKT